MAASGPVEMLLIEGAIMAKNPNVTKEKELQEWVESLAECWGWLRYHTVDSRFNVSGFPDLVLVREKSFLCVELKSQRGRIEPAQEKWLSALELAGVEVKVWRPTDIPSVIERLRICSDSEPVLPSPSSGRS